MQNQNRWRCRGIGFQVHFFTMVELLLVLVILAVLAGIVFPNFSGRSRQARITAAQAEISSLEVALDAFEIDNGYYPEGGVEALQVLTERPAGSLTWRGPYLRRAIVADPWGNPYRYEYPGRNNLEGYDLSSMGPDGKPGGGDDVVNW